MAAVVADDPLRLARRAGGVEHVERIGRRDLDALGRGDRVAAHHRRPVDVVLPELGLHLLALEDDAVVGLVGAAPDRRVEHRLVGDRPVRLDAARGGDDDLGRRVLDARGELGRGEAAEDDRVDRADPRAREHRDERLGDHRHVDDDAIALVDPERPQHPGELRDLLQELGVGQRAGGAGDGALVDEGGLVGAAGDDVPVERVVARVHRAVGEPAVERHARFVERRARPLDPRHAVGHLPPVALRVGRAAVVDFAIGAGAHWPILSRRPPSATGTEGTWARKRAYVSMNGRPRLPTGPAEPNGRTSGWKSGRTSGPGPSDEHLTDPPQRHGTELLATQSDPRGIMQA